MLFDWLVAGQVVPCNPARSVRSPKHVVKNGKTPVLSAEEARRLLDGIDLPTLAGQRNRAPIGVLVFRFARIAVAISMRVADDCTQGDGPSPAPREGGRYNVVPVHPPGQETEGAYLEAAELVEDQKGSLFRNCAVGRQDRLEDRAMSRATAPRMNKRRARQAGLLGETCAHSFRGTGSRCTCGTAATLRWRRGSPGTSRRRPRSSTTGCRRRLRSTGSSEYIV